MCGAPAAPTGRLVFDWGVTWRASPIHLCKKPQRMLTSTSQRCIDCCCTLPIHDRDDRYAQAHTTHLKCCVTQQHTSSVVCGCTYCGWQKVKGNHRHVWFHVLVLLLVGVHRLPHHRPALPCCPVTKLVYGTGVAAVGCVACLCGGGVNGTSSMHHGFALSMFRQDMHGPPCNKAVTRVFCHCAPPQRPCLRSKPPF